MGPVLKISKHVAADKIWWCGAVCTLVLTICKESASAIIVDVGDR